VLTESVVLLISFCLADGMAATGGLLILVQVLMVIFLVEFVAGVKSVMTLPAFILVYTLRFVLRFTYLIIWFYDLTHGEFSLWLAVEASGRWPYLFAATCVLCACDLARALIPNVIGVHQRHKWTASLSVLTLLCMLIVVWLLTTMQDDVGYAVHHALWGCIAIGSFSTLMLDVLVAFCVVRLSGSAPLLDRAGNPVFAPANQTVDAQLLRVYRELCTASGPVIVQPSVVLESLRVTALPSVVASAV
jgi:hypothetical protein